MTQFQDKLDTVLIIDDEPFETEWLTEYFQARGYRVIQADDLQSALAALETIRYAYIVIDLSIPVNSFTSAAACRFRPGVLSLPRSNGRTKGTHDGTQYPSSDHLFRARFR